MFRSFSGFLHEHAEPPYWYRIEFYGRQDDGSWFVGAAYLCDGLIRGDVQEVLAKVEERIANSTS